MYIYKCVYIYICGWYSVYIYICNVAIVWCVCAHGICIYIYASVILMTYYIYKWCIYIYCMFCQEYIYIYTFALLFMMHLNIFVCQLFCVYWSSQTSNQSMQHIMQTDTCKLYHLTMYYQTNKHIRCKIIIYYVNKRACMYVYIYILIVLVWGTASGALRCSVRPPPRCHKKGVLPT